MSRIPGTPTFRGAFHALMGSFLRRFFDNEITGGTHDLKTSLFWLIGFLAAPLTLLPVTFMFRSRLIVLLHGADALRVLSRPIKVLVITLGMAAAGLVAAIVWNSLMLERRDGLILGTLPVEGRTVVLAKLAALATYVFGIAAAMHFVSSILFGITLADGSDSLQLVLLSPVAHFIATVGSCAFVFLAVTAAQGLALTLSGPGGFRRVSPMLQVALVAGIVIGFTQISNVADGIARANQLGAVTAPAVWLQLAPPVWFLGLYEWILGNAEPAYRSLAVTAIVAFAAVTAITLGSYVTVYQRVMVRAVESPEEASGAWRVSALFEWITRRLSRRPIRRAAAQFYFASVGRVERLRFVVAVTMGLLCAWIIPALGVLLAGEVRPSPRTTFALSYASLLLVLIGLRIAISMPADLRAAWIVPMIDAPGRALRSGLWRALFLTSVVPVVVSFAVLHAWLWDLRVALQHAAVMTAAGVVLVEGALWHFDDLPNRRPWRPENANLRAWWPAYLMGFSTITGTVPQVEWAFRDSLPAHLTIVGVALAIAAAIRLAHRRPYPTPSIEIETFVEPVQVLKLE